MSSSSSSSSSSTPPNAPIDAQQVSAALQEAADLLIRAMVTVPNGRINEVVARIVDMAREVGRKDTHTSLAKKRNTVDKKEYEKHARRETIIVRMFEVGVCSCTAVGPSGFFCGECAEPFGTHMRAPARPTHRVRLPNSFHDSEDEDAAASSASSAPNKKRKKNATRETSKPGPPKTLEEFVSMLFWSSVGNWAEHCEGYTRSIHEDLEEHFYHRVADKYHAYWTDDLSSHLWDTIEARTGQLAKVVNGFFPEEMKQRKLYWDTRRREEEPLILKLIKDFSVRPPKKKEEKKKKKKKKKKKNTQ